MLISEVDKPFDFAPLIVCYELIDNIQKLLMLSELRRSL